MTPCPRGPPTGGSSTLRYLWQCGLLETLVTATLCSTFMMCFAPISGSTRFRVWYQLPDLFLLPRTWDVGIPLYWTLCFVWGGVIGVLAASVESVILLATRRIFPVKPLLYAKAPISAIVGILEATSPAREHHHEFSAHPWICDFGCITVFEQPIPFRASRADQQLRNHWGLIRGNFQPPGGKPPRVSGSTLRSLADRFPQLKPYVR